MKMPTQISFVESFYLTDGGTIVLITEESDHSRHEITLFQSLLLDNINPDKLPGRLYFDKHLIQVRSGTEAEVIHLLKNGIINEEPPPNPNPSLTSNDSPGMIIGDDLKEYSAKLAEGKSAVIRHLRDLLIARVESKDYLALAQKIGDKC